MTENKQDWTTTELNNLSGKSSAMVGWNPDNPKSIEIYSFDGDGGNFHQRNLDTPRKVAKALLEFQIWNWNRGYLSFDLPYSSSMDDYDSSKYFELRADLDLDNWRPEWLLKEGCALFNKMSDFIIFDLESF